MPSDTICYLRWNVKINIFWVDWFYVLKPTWKHKANKIAEMKKKNVESSIWSFIIVYIKANSEHISARWKNTFAIFIYNFVRDKQIIFFLPKWLWFHWYFIPFFSFMHSYTAAAELVLTIVSLSTHNQSDSYPGPAFNSIQIKRKRNPIHIHYWITPNVILQQTIFVQTSIDPP